MKHLNKCGLPLVVFLTGACVLVIEIVATRILSPFYGNTIYTVSGVISIVLAALSVGYYVGGKYADKYPTEKVFYSIILASGLSVLLLLPLTRFLLPSLGYSLSMISGPVITAIILFFLPSFLLGTLSPFAIKLQEQLSPEKGIGSIAGEMFFWSTLGSIFGSLLTGFLLIPQFGISRIILAVAVILITLGLLPLIRIGFLKKKILSVILLSGAVLIYLSFCPSPESKNLVYKHDGVYEQITIYDEEYDGRPARFFQQDRSSSGAMFLNTDELVFDYTKYYSLYEVFKPVVNNALVIGGGAYSIPKALLKDLPQANIDVSEIEPSLYFLSQKYFKISETPRLNNYSEDGRRMLRDTDKKYDLVFSDVYYSLFSIPSHFTSLEFFKIAKDKLSENGIFIANLIGDLSRQKPSLIMSEIKTFQTAFPNSYYFAVDSPGKTGSQNIIFVGYNSDKTIDFNDPRITGHSNPVVRSLRNKIINLDRYELSNYPLLTDDYSPVEYLTARILRKSFGKSKLINGEEMQALVDQQLRYGPRYLSAPGHKSVQKFIVAESNTLMPETNLQTWQYINSAGQKFELTNIIGRLYTANKKRIILATHYDSKKIADLNSVKTNQPVPGANDSASGVAVLLELARILSNSRLLPNIGIDFVFFDSEEGDENQEGNYTNWKPLGSTYFADHLDEIYGNNKPASAIVLDMVCDKNLIISKEQLSAQYAPYQLAAFWSIANKLDSKVFPDRIGPKIIDDHIPLNQAGIPSFLLIDFEYPPFHTINDTPDKCSAKSLETIANAVLNYIYTLK